MNNTNNTMATEKAYIGNGRQKAGSEYIKLSLCIDDLLALMHSHGKEASNGKAYLNCIVAKRRSADNYGRTHTVYLPPVENDEEARNNRVADLQEIQYHQE